MNAAKMEMSAKNSSYMPQCKKKKKNKKLFQTARGATYAAERRR